VVCLEERLRLTAVRAFMAIARALAEKPAEGRDGRRRVAQDGPSA
jgi:hypothetical protein